MCVFIDGNLTFEANRSHIQIHPFLGPILGFFQRNRTSNILLDPQLNRIPPKIIGLGPALIEKPLDPKTQRLGFTANKIRIIHGFNALQYAHKQNDSIISLVRHCTYYD